MFLGEVRSTIRPSRQLKRKIVLSCCFASIVLLNASTDRFMGISSLLGLMLAGAYTYRRWGTLQDPRSVVSLRLNGSAICVQERFFRVRRGRIKSPRVVSDQWVILYWKAEGGRRRRVLLIMRDSLEEQEFWRLRVLMRHPL